MGTYANKERISKIKLSVMKNVCNYVTFSGGPVGLIFIHGISHHMDFLAQEAKN